MTYGLHKKLITILNPNKKYINKIIWKILGNIAASTDSQTQMLINEDIACYINSYLFKDFSTYDYTILREILWLCSNMFCGTISQISYLVTNGTIKRIIEMNQAFLDLNFTNEEAKIEEKKQIIYVIFLILTF